MPTKPTKKVEANSVQILNAIRNDIGGSYADQIPEAYAAGDVVNGEVITRERALQRLRDIGKAFMTFEPQQNAFLNALVNRIGLVLISNRLYENPWARFKRGYLEYGETVEEIFVNIAQAFQFDPVEAETDVFKQVKPDVRAAFHTMNYQKFYKVTVNEPQLRQAFLSFEGVSDLISKIVESLYTSANYDEFLMMKYTIAKAIVEGRMYPLQIPEVTAANSNDIVIAMRNISDLATFMSQDYNQAGVANYSDKDHQYLILNTKFLNTISVETLAMAFNLDKAELYGHIIPVNGFEFTPLESQRVLNLVYPDNPPAALFTAEELEILASCPGVLVDDAWFMIFDNYESMRQQVNEQGLYWNYFYHVWKTFSTSPYSTAIYFTTDSQELSSLAVAPNSVTFPKTIGATATIEITGNRPLTATDNIRIATDSPVIEKGKPVYSNGKASILLSVKALPEGDYTNVDYTVIGGTNIRATFKVTVA